MYPAAQSATAVPLFIKDSLMISQRDFPFISRWGNGIVMVPRRRLRNRLIGHAPDECNVPETCMSKQRPLL